MVKIWNEKLKDVLIRAFKTFIQGFLATLIVLIKETDLTDESLLKSVLIGALAGGISAVMNLILKALDDEKQTTFNMDTFDDDEEVDE